MTGGVWQTMASAPRDGTPIVALTVDGILDTLVWGRVHQPKEEDCWWEQINPGEQPPLYWANDGFEDPDQLYVGWVPFPEGKAPTSPFEQQRESD